MAASVKLIKDMQTVISNGPSVTTSANAIAAAGPIMDYVGGTNLVLLKFEECAELLSASGTTAIPRGILSVTASGDDSTNLALLQGIQATLTNLTAPSAHVIADMKTVISNGPSTTTKANAVAAGGPIMDYPGNCTAVLIKLEECSELLSASGAGAIPKGIVFVTASSDDNTNLSLLQNVQLVLS
jgi:hypothetical protein